MKKPNVNSIDKVLKEHYASKSLSENQLNDLFAMQISDFESRTSERDAGEGTSQKASEGKTDIKAGWLSRLLPNFNAYRYAFYLTAFMLLGCLFTVYTLLDQAPLSQRIMSEIVYNHKQDMPIEVASSSLTDIGSYLNKLSFSVVLPSALTQPEWKFLGGRYCSLNGKLAALLKIKNLKNNNVYTMYQTKTESGFEDSQVESLSDVIEGVDVSIWREQGLLLGLAREAKPSY